MFRHMLSPKWKPRQTPVMRTPAGYSEQHTAGSMPAAQPASVSVAAWTSQQAASDLVLRAMNIGMDVAPACEKVRGAAVATAAGASQRSTTRNIHATEMRSDHSSCLHITVALHNHGNINCRLLHDDKTMEKHTTRAHLPAIPHTTMDARSLPTPLSLAAPAAATAAANSAMHDSTIHSAKCCGKPACRIK
jgi:hypothetical protein